MKKGTKTLDLLQATLVTGEVCNDNPAKVEPENGGDEVSFDPDGCQESYMTVLDAEVESGVDTDNGMQIVVFQGAVDDVSIDSVNPSLDGMSDLEPRNVDDFVSPVGEIIEDQVNWMMVKGTIEPDKVTVMEANQQPNLNVINVEDTFTQVQPEEALIDGVDVENAQRQVLQLVRTPYSSFNIMVYAEQQARLQLNQVQDQGEAGIQNQGEEFFDAMDEAGQEIAIDEFDDYSLPTFDPGGVKDSIILTTLNNLQQVSTISRISTVQPTYTLANSQN